MENRAMQNLPGKTAFVTGGASGIGLGIAKALLGAGMKVVIAIVTLLPRIMRHGEGGHIVNTASMSGLVPHPGATLYGTSKGAVVAMIECMRGELEPHGIVCSAFCPGAVQSNIAEAGKTR